MEKGQENMIDVDQNSKKDIFAVQCSFGKNIWQFQKAEHYLKWSNGGPKGRPNVVRIITIRNTVAAANSRRPSVLLVKDHMLMRVLLWLMLQHDNGKENNASLNALQAIIQDYLQDSKGFQSLDLRQDTKSMKNKENTDMHCVSCIAKKAHICRLYFALKLFDLFSTFHIIFYKPKTSWENQTENEIWGGWVVLEKFEEKITLVQKGMKD